jgi:hypothetical protein
MGIDAEQTGRGRGVGGQNKRQGVNTSVEPGNFAMYKRQIMCQKASGERQKGVTTDVKLMDWTARNGVLALPSGIFSPRRVAGVVFGFKSSQAAFYWGFLIFKSSQRE